MAANFRRPSLNLQLFEPYNEPAPRSGTGLRAVFQNRQPTSSNLPKSYGTGLKNVFKNRQENNEPGLSLFANSNSSNEGLKGVFQMRQSGISMSRESLVNLDSIQSRNNELYNETSFFGSSLRNDTGEFSIGYHSIHRLDLNKQQSGGNLRKAFEARMGGTSVNTLGRHTFQNEALENHADLIVSKMEQDKCLMEDSPDAEELRKNALRDMPQSLTIKRHVKVKLSKSVSQKSRKKTLSCYKMLKYRVSMAISKLKLDIIDLTYSFELWYSALKKIEGNFGTGVASFFKLLRWLFLVNLLIAVVSFSFIVVPFIIYGPSNTANFSAKDIVTGEGYITGTILYYGYYNISSITIIGTLSYSVTNAYIFTMAIIYFISVFVIGVSAAKSYKRSYIETEGGLKNIFANKVFCGWDYNIATKDAAELKSKAIYNELNELINDFAWRKRKLTFVEKMRTRAIQFFSNVLVIGIMTATGYAIRLFLDQVSLDTGTLIIVTPVFINLVMMFMPMLFSIIIKYEDYKDPKVSLVLTLMRTFVLGVVTIGVLASYWLKNKNIGCWETSLGQEIYRMIIFDFFISVMFAALLDCVLFGIYKLTNTAALEFDIAWNTMQIIYNQTLFWVGLVFVPLLPIITVIKLFLMWYIRQSLVLCLCKPPTKIWRAAQASTWFLLFTFLSLLAVCGFLGYVISSVPLSQTCGPFQGYEFFLDVITEGIFQMKTNHQIWENVLNFTGPGLIALILIGLCCLVYILRAKANAQKETVAQYRNMLLWSAKDKEYYYSLISQITNRDYVHNFNDRDTNPHLHPPEHGVGDIQRVASSSSFTYEPSPAISTVEPSTSSLFDFGHPVDAFQPKKYL